MKKFLLLTVASCMGIASYAADAKWTASVNGIFEKNEPVYSGNVVTMDAEGNTYVAGQYTKEEVSINGTTYEGIGNSSYLVKYDPTGAAMWSVNFKGAVTITAIACDNARVPYIYVAGTYADEVVLGNNQGFDPETITGAKIDDAYVTEQTSAFIAKYRASDGCLNVNTTFVPEEIPGALNLGGDAFFNINDLHIYDRTLYATAIYGGVTKNGEAEFNGYSKYDPEWFCSLYCKSASLFTLTTGLADCNNIINCGPGKDLTESDKSCMTTGVRMLVADENNIYTVFSAYGPVVVKEKNATDKSVDCEEGVASYIFRKVKGAKSMFIGLVNEDIDALEPFAPAALVLDNGNLLCLTYQTVNEGEGEAEQKVRQTSVYTVKSTRFTNNSVEASKAYAQADIDYSIIKKAEYISGAWNCTLQGRDNKGNYTADFKTGILNGEVFNAAPVANAVTFDSNGEVSVYATVSGEGVTYAQYLYESAGINDIIVDDENAPVEYYNLQGIRVNNPENGIYIRRQGSKVSKMYVK